MEVEVIKPFINHDVEVLVGGVWIEGTLAPIVKGVVNLLPIGDAKGFYGPAAFKLESVVAIRQLKRNGPELDVVKPPFTPDVIRSSQESISPVQRFRK